METHPLEDKRIYVIEDNPVNMAVTAVILKRTGATILQDYWNVNVIENISQRLPIDVILLDLMLRHDMSGYDLFDDLQADPRVASIPVIAVSAADPGVEIPKAQVKGLAGFIGKPIVPRLFPEQIASCINGESIWYAQTGHMEE